MSKFEEPANIEKAVAKICAAIPKKNAGNFKNYFNQLCWSDKNDILTLMDETFGKPGKFTRNLGVRLAEEFGWISQNRRRVEAFVLAGANQHARTNRDIYGDRNFFEPAGPRVPAKSTPLLQLAALYQGDDELLKILLKDNPALEARNRFGETALMIAVQHQNVDFVKTLVENGANIHAKNNQGMGIAFYAEEAWGDDMRKYVKKLLSKKPGFNLKK